MSSSARQDYYQLLGVAASATRDEIKQAFRRQARLHHPDLHPDDPQAAENFRRLRQAYETLTDEKQRAAYDRERRQSTAAARPQPEAAASPQVAYVRGVEKLQQQDYLGALSQFGRALALDPHFTKAYLKRCEVLLHLGRDRDILDDCQKLLKLEPNNAGAYYYRGRARQNLGYTQAALQAYARAIQHHSERRDLYYHRGNAYNESGDLQGALRDWQHYADLCQRCNDTAGYRAAMAAIARHGLQKPDLAGSVRRGLMAVAHHARAYLWAASRILRDPVGGMLPAYMRVGAVHTAPAGCTYAAVVASSMQLSFWGRWLPTELAFDGWPWLVLGLLPFACLLGTGILASYFGGSRVSIDASAFIAGAALLPLGGFVLGGGLLRILGGLQLYYGAAIFSGCWLVLSLYGGYTRLLKLPEGAAAIAVPMALAASIWIAYGFALTIRS